MKFRAFAPANLALIKYMGKRPASSPVAAGADLFQARRAQNPAAERTRARGAGGADRRFDNLPLNDSLSFTLNHFIAAAEIERREEKESSGGSGGSLARRPRANGESAPPPPRQAYGKLAAGRGLSDSACVEQAAAPAGADSASGGPNDDEWRPLEEAAPLHQREGERQNQIDGSGPGAQESAVGGQRAPSGLCDVSRALSCGKFALSGPSASPDSAAPGEAAPLAPIKAVALSPDEQKRFLGFFRFLKEIFHLEGSYIVRSGANFPPRAGLAGSAAAFAALTQAAFQAAKQNGRKDFSEEQLSRLSRAGSGSSCRSFFSPWALWSGEGAKAVRLPGGDRIHRALILKNAPYKKISSSEAHQRVRTSPLFAGRAERAQKRLSKLLRALKAGRREWRTARAIVWEEFEDMHRLFETADPPFSFKESPAVEEALRHLDRLEAQTGDGPLVTMDAGPSIHLLFRKDQAEMTQDLKKDFPQFKVLPDIL